MGLGPSSEKSGGLAANSGVATVSSTPQKVQQGRAVQQYSSTKHPASSPADKDDTLSSMLASEGWAAHKKKRTLGVSIPSPNHQEEDPHMIMIMSPTDPTPIQGAAHANMIPPRPSLPVTIANSPAAAAVPTVFRWNGKGKSVELAGSFNQWQERIPMVPSQQDFTCLQNLPPGVYQYKYIVDGEWQIDPQQPSVIEHGVENNVIEIHTQRKEDKLANQKVSTSPPGSYGTEIPMDIPEASPPILPPHLQHALLNTDPIQNDPSLLPLPHHVMLNHLYSLKRKEEHVMILGVTQRYSKSSEPDSQKFVTTVFYKPLQ